MLRQQASIVPENFDDAQPQQPQLSIVPEKLEEQALSAKQEPMLRPIDRIQFNSSAGKDAELRDGKCINDIQHACPLGHSCALR